MQQKSSPVNALDTDQLDMDESNPKGRLGKAFGLGDQAYDAMKERLIRGAFRPGHKLTVRSVADILAVGTTPARDALNRLVAEHALVYAGPKTLIVPVLSLPQLYEITQIRLALEGLAAEKSAPHLTAQDVEKLEITQERINAALDEHRYADALWHNKEFHFGIYGRSEMPSLLAMIESLWLRVGAAFHDLYPEFAVSKYGVNNHRSALEGLRHGDPLEVRAAMETDIRDGYRRLRRALKERK